MKQRTVQLLLFLPLNIHLIDVPKEGHPYPVPGPNSSDTLKPPMGGYQTGVRSFGSSLVVC